MNAGQSLSICAVDTLPTGRMELARERRLPSWGEGCGVLLPLSVLLAVMMLYCLVRALTPCLLVALFYWYIDVLVNWCISI